MALDAIQQNNFSNNDLRRKSFLKSAAIASVTAYAMKYAIPILPQEKDDVFLKEEDQLIEDAKITNTEVDVLRQSRTKIKGADEFIRLFDEKKIDLTEKPKYELSEDLQKIYSEVTSKIAGTKNLELDKRLAFTKQKRPAVAFLVAGAFVGLFSALIHNVYVENAKSGIDYDTLPL